MRPEIVGKSGSVGAGELSGSGIKSRLEKRSSTMPGSLLDVGLRVAHACDVNGCDEPRMSPRSVGRIANRLGEELADVVLKLLACTVNFDELVAITAMSESSSSSIPGDSILLVGRRGMGIELSRLLKADRTPSRPSMPAV